MKNCLSYRIICGNQKGQLGNQHDENHAQDEQKHEGPYGSVNRAETQIAGHAPHDEQTDAKRRCHVPDTNGNDEQNPVPDETEAERRQDRQEKGAVMSKAATVSMNMPMIKKNT